MNNEKTLKGPSEVFFNSLIHRENNKDLYIVLRPQSSHDSLMTTSHVSVNSNICCLIFPPCPPSPIPPPPTNKQNVQMKLNLTCFGSVSVPLVTDFAGFELVDWNLPSMRPKHKTVLCSWHFTKPFCVTQQNVKTSKHEKKTDQKICSNQEWQEWRCCW